MIESSNLLCSQFHIVFQANSGGGDGGGSGDTNSNDSSITTVEGESGQVYENVSADKSIENGGADTIIPA